MGFGSGLKKIFGKDKNEEMGNSKNFKYLDDMIHSGAKEIVLDSDITLSVGEKRKYRDGIKLDVDGLVIDGNGHSIDVKNKTRIFDINSEVTIKNLTLKSGYALEGGAIYIHQDSDVSISDCQFQENTAKEDGGAIINRGKLTITESTFDNNTAEHYGGAIYNGKGELIVISSTLNNNTAQYQGGAIYNEGKLKIFESTLNENTSSNGGAIYNDREDSSLTINDSTLNDNTAGHGGTIYNCGVLTIIDSTLNNNIAKYKGGAIFSAVIYNYEGGELTISESTLTGNTAKSDGGAIYNGSGELTIISSTLNENITNSSGGAIHNNEGELTISESTFTGNTAQEKGGAIYNWGKLTITESTLMGNTSKDCGAVYSSGDFKIYNSEFSNNKSPNNIILNKDSLQIHDAIFKNNQSKFIVLNDGDMSNLNIFNGEFKENYIVESVIYNIGKFCGLEKTVFQNNISNNEMNIINKSELNLTAPKIKDKGKSILNQNYILIRKSSPELEKTIYGDGKVENIEERIQKGESFDFGYLDKKIHESKNKEIILEHDITFENYERDFYEGGIELDIDNLIINGNGKTINGLDKSRIFFITGKNITLKNIVFKNGHSHKNYDNPLNNNGGAIKVNYNANTRIENCKFINNASEEDGGAICNRGAELTITKSTLNKNIANRSGGAIQNDEGELTITKSTLNENIVNRSGGAIQNDEGELTIIESIINNNAAKSGGAIHNFVGKSTITESTINNNFALYYAGAIDNNEGELTIHNSTLTGNTAKEEGGTIHNNADKSTITKSTINNNTSEYGGAICNYGELTITESTLNENTAKSGGAIYNREKESLNIKNCNFENNKPNDVKSNKKIIKNHLLIKF